MGMAAPTPAYRDEPDDAVSLHTTPDAYTDNDPPSYADSEADAAPRAPIYHTPPPTTRTDHSQPVLRNGKPQVCTTTTHMDPRYDTDPIYLESSLRTLATSAPKPFIYIMGTHRETTTRRDDKKETHTVTDFRIVLDLSPYLHPNFSTTDTSPMRLTTVSNGEKTHRGGVVTSRASRPADDVEHTAPSLTEWCHRFCASPARLRIFRLTRCVTGLDESYLRARIEVLLRATGYRGRVSISFPVEDAYADIYTSHAVNRWRNTRWVCWVFYLSCLWVVAWPLLWLCTKRYAVVRAEWPFSVAAEATTAVEAEATTPPNPETTDPTTPNPKLYTTVSEPQYITRWGPSIQRLALDRFQGAASEELMRAVAARSTVDADARMSGWLGGGAVMGGLVGVLGGVSMSMSGSGGGGSGRGSSGRGNSSVMDLAIGLARDLQGEWGNDT